MIVSLSVIILSVPTIVILLQSRTILYAQSTIESQSKEQQDLYTGPSERSGLASVPEARRDLARWRQWAPGESFKTAQ